LADTNLERFTELRTAFGEVALADEVSAFERSKWLFLWAEAEAHLSPSGRTFETLKRIAENLSGPEIPLDLRLRAGLDLAGMRARNGDLAGAVQILEPLVTSTPKGAVGNHNEQELLIAATGYLLVVRGLAATGNEQKDYASKLSALLLDVTRAGAAPPTLQMWLMMWRAEFDSLVAKQACKGRAACEKRVAQQRGADFDRVAEALGERVAQLLARGVLPVGGVQIELRYQNRGRLQPEIAVSPQFILVQVPALAERG
jgi:hypothetical protein